RRILGLRSAAPPLRTPMSFGNYNSLLLACFAPGVSFAPGIASANRTVTAIAFADGETSRLREFSRGSARRPVRLARPARPVRCLEMLGRSDRRSGRDQGPNVPAIR